MRKIILPILMVKIGFASVCNEVNLREHLPLMRERVEVVSKQERNGLCELVLKDGGGYFTLYAGKDFVIAGAMISRGVNLSQESILRAQAEDIKKLLPELDKLAVAKESRGEKTLYMITDPECPYCEASKKRAYELAKERGWSTAIVWFPLPSHPQAEKKAISFVCEKRTWQDYLNGLYGTSSCEEGISKVAKSKELLQSIVSGTPTFILSTGEVVVGANIRALEEKLR